MNSNKYRYRPLRFYITVFLFTWLLWFAAAWVTRSSADGNGIGILFMLLGLFVPSVTAMTTVLTSKNAALKADLKNKLIGLFRVKPQNVLISILVFVAIIAVSIVLSTLIGQSLNQFALADFSFSAGGSALLTIILAALLEELGWRGYAEDSIAAYHSWFNESIIFGLVWAFWHMPLFLIPDTYHYNILQQSPWFMVNFFVSVMPIGFLFTWVYVKNNRSILACMIFHFFVNFLQEKIAMTQVTKCVETAVLFAVAAAVVALNRDMFLETRHVGDLLGEEKPNDRAETFSDVGQVLLCRRHYNEYAAIEKNISIRNFLDGDQPGAGAAMKEIGNHDAIRKNMEIELKEKMMEPEGGRYFSTLGMCWRSV